MDQYCRIDQHILWTLSMLYLLFYRHTCVSLKIMEKLLSEVSVEHFLSAQCDNFSRNIYLYILESGYSLDLKCPRSRMKILSINSILFDSLTIPQILHTCSVHTFRIHVEITTHSLVSVPIDIRVTWMTSPVNFAAPLLTRVDKVKAGQYHYPPRAKF